MGGAGRDRREDECHSTQYMKANITYVRMRMWGEKGGEALHAIR